MTICTALALCLLEGEHLERVVHVFEVYKAEKKLTIDRLGKLIAEELKNSGVTKPRETLDAHNIFTSPQYPNVRFFSNSLL